MALLDHRGQAVPAAEIRRVKAEANRGEWGELARSYEGAGNEGQWFGRWRTGIKSPDLEYLPNRDQLVARGRDLRRNEPVAGAAVSRKKNAVVGRGWRLSAKPNARALGITPEQAAELGAQMELEFRQHAYGHAFACDAERKQTFGQQLRLAVDNLMTDGEGFGVCEWAPEEGTRYATRLRLVDGDRVSNPTGKINNAYFRNGIESNRLGQPVRYWIRQAHPADYVWTGEAFQWVGVDRFTAWGRPQVFHWYDPERAHQSRGVSRFVQTLKMFRAFSKFTDYTLQNAAMNALKVGFAYTSVGPDAVSDALGIKDIAALEAVRRAHYAEHPVTDGQDEAHFAVLPYGDKVEMATAGRGLTGFDSFIRAIIRLIAASLGVTYEEISMDFSQTNYSSARAALLIARAETDAIQGILEAQLVRPFYVAFLEEAFDKGYIAIPAGAPAFEDAPDAYAEARWIGPGAGYVDPVKEVLAAAARMEAGITTLDDECAASGYYWEDQMHQQARENALREELHLEPAGMALAQAIEDTKNPAKQAPKPSDDEGDPVVAPEDQMPPTGAPKDARRAAVYRVTRRADGRALAALAQVANSAEHEASLDARVNIAA